MLSHHTGEVEPWNGKNPPPIRISCRSKTRTFVVFRQDLEQGIGSYTEDIGDLCIFLGQREAFCVSATEYPGLHPNSVYYASSGTGFGYYDLSSNTLHDVIHEAPFSWLAPLQDEESIISRVRDLAPKFLWEVETHELQDKYKKTETVLFCRKIFWAIV
ncbi:hypothetical protein ARALYDRAFT_908291 [Arabidopsis lyrata subsp. lyrata]|uniref:KIB1-4 beta-propeller domain-containing protein n=1 Tax=Arabidopsis lyrata subsp. lyrata TaxID=81972 RepID=D7LXF3_ARALL|nr:hypothetical protein ARALYDRAFT_908291 [Arabidopsis lyrata subsp. lyrata]